MRNYCCGVLLLLLSSVVDAGTTFCAQSPDAHYLRLSYSRIDATRAGGLPLTHVDTRRYQWEALVLGKIEKEKTTKQTTPGTRQWRAGFGHEYTVLEFDGLSLPQPQSNGDLHTLYAPVHWLYPNFRFSLAPALSVSSNGLKHPGKLNGDTVQMWLALERSYRVSPDLTWLLGVCADHRFGHYQGYPVAGLLWQPGERWSARLAYPDTSVRFRASPRLSLALAANPDGNEWHVLDSGLEQRSTFIREAWRIELQLNWKMTQSLTLTAALGKSLEPRLRMSLQDNRRLQMDLDNDSYGAIELRWGFSGPRR